MSKSTYSQNISNERAPWTRFAYDNVGTGVELDPVEGEEYNTKFFLKE